MEIKLVGNILTIIVTLSEGTPSNSGRSNVVATTSGFTAVEDSDVRVSLNVIRPLKRRR